MEFLDKIAWGGNDDSGNMSIRRKEHIRLYRPTLIAIRRQDKIRALVFVATPVTAGTATIQLLLYPLFRRIVK